MSNALSKNLLDLCGFALATAACADDKRKISLSTSSHRLELRTLFASSDGRSQFDIEGDLSHGKTLVSKDEETTRRKGSAGTSFMRLSKTLLTEGQRLLHAKAINKTPATPRVTGSAIGSVSGS